MTFRTIKIKNKSKVRWEIFENLCNTFGYSYEIVIDNSLNLIPQIFDNDGKMITSPGSDRIEVGDESRILTKSDRAKYRSAQRNLQQDRVFELTLSCVEEES
ncbi:hypothetical protein BG262_04780 [Floricoccus penangensis]|uniref:Uncharacterized protein n=1 Tax=Floricoccus penangensis TaxID=1859475 RepID=A0A9Q5JFF9_9LACT|nr:hypothetical protein [Floricoccus penangensis]OFI46333.1 hypothetical protein BG262_04780 [Floricoccus penangensis]